MRVSVSFVYPMHNAEQTIASSLQRLLDQLSDLCEAFEIIAVDDGSTDDTLGELREIAGRFAQIRVVHRPLRYGHSAAVQLGLRKARAPYVLIYNDIQQPITTQIYELWSARLGSPVGRTAATMRSRVTILDRSEDLSDFGQVLEFRGLLLVQRWNRPDAVALEDFVRTMEDASMASGGEELLSAPHFLSAGLSRSLASHACVG